MKNIGLKKLLPAVILIAVFSLSYGCRPAGTSDTATDHAVYSGGQDLGHGVNLKDIAVSSDENVTQITLYFIHGSRNASVTEAKLNAVPLYSARLLPAPQRLAVSLAVDYWDYPEIDGRYKSSLIYGSFQAAPSMDNRLHVYFQLNGDASVSFTENRDRLTVTLKPKGGAQVSRHFVGLNAFEEYEQNLVPAALGLSPTLCADYSNIMLISEPISSAADADAFAAAVSEEIAGIASINKPYTFVLEPGILPAYNASVDTEAASRKPVLQIDGKGRTLPVLVENGRYLCTSPAGDIVYARNEPGPDAPGNFSQRLWVLDKYNRNTDLNLPNFSNAEQAAWSPDGNYLAVLDSSSHAKVLYVYVPETKELKNLGEEGFGSVTASFTWDIHKNVIYALTGQSDMRLLRYDFDAEADSRISPAGDISGLESALATDGTNLYLADASAQAGREICSVNIVTGERSAVSPGISFKLSGDGRYLAVLAPSDAEGREDTFDLSVVALSSGFSALVDRGIFVEDFEFSPEGKELFYTASAGQDIGGGYHNALVRYSIAEEKSHLIGYSTLDILSSDRLKNRMYFVDYFDARQENFCATYIYALSGD